MPLRQCTFWSPLYKQTNLAKKRTLAEKLPKTRRDRLQQKRQKSRDKKQVYKQLPKAGEKAAGEQRAAKAFLRYVWIKEIELKRNKIKIIYFFSILIIYFVGGDGGCYHRMA